MLVLVGLVRGSSSSKLATAENKCQTSHLGVVLCSDDHSTNFGFASASRRRGEEDDYLKITPHGTGDFGASLQLLSPGTARPKHQVNGKPVSKSVHPLSSRPFFNCVFPVAHDCQFLGEHIHLSCTATSSQQHLPASHVQHGHGSFLHHAAVQERGRDFLPLQAQA